MREEAEEKQAEIDALLAELEGMRSAEDRGTLIQRIEVLPTEECSAYYNNICVVGIGT